LFQIPQLFKKTTADKLDLPCLSGLSAHSFLSKQISTSQTNQHQPNEQGSLVFDFLPLWLARLVRKEMRKNSFLQAGELKASSGMVWIASASGM
jgi:hypothetical protein